LGVALKYTWKGRWRDGEITVEADNFRELEAALEELSNVRKVGTGSNAKVSYPQIPSILGCTDAVRALIESDWGKKPRPMSEIKHALEDNQLYFSKGALSATLVTLSKKGDIHRVKEEGKWKYFSK
jgi:hypothetical protein